MSELTPALNEYYATERRLLTLPPTHHAAATARHAYIPASGPIVSMAQPASVPPTKAPKNCELENTPRLAPRWAGSAVADATANHAAEAAVVVVAADVAAAAAAAEAEAVVDAPAVAAEAVDVAATDARPTTR